MSPGFSPQAKGEEPQCQAPLSGGRTFQKRPGTGGAAQSVGEHSSPLLVLLKPGPPSPPPPRPCGRRLCPSFCSVLESSESCFRSRTFRRLTGQSVSSPFSTPVQTLTAQLTQLRFLVRVPAEPRSTLSSSVLPDLT